MWGPYSGPSPLYPAAGRGEVEGDDRPPRSHPVGKEVAMTGMTDGIIAGYDGSACSDEALRWAAREAWARGTALTICLAWPAPDLLQLGDWGAHDRARQLGGDILARGVRLAGGGPRAPGGPPRAA